MEKKDTRTDVLSKAQVARIIQLEDDVSKNPANDEKSKELVMLYAVHFTRN